MRLWTYDKNDNVVDALTVPGIFTLCIPEQLPLPVQDQLSDLAIKTLTDSLESGQFDYIYVDHMHVMPVRHSETLTAAGIAGAILDRKEKGLLFILEK